MGIQPNQVKQIKQRKSYTILLRAFKKMRANGGDAFKNLRILYETLDEYKAFGSKANSVWARESMKLIIQEYGTTETGHTDKE